jgi:(2Fe-2S) ferredoxin/predicted O-methyltransferase YrrM
MEPFRYHVFVCDQQKPEGVPCCAARGAGRLIDALRREIAIRRLGDEVQVTVCGSLGLCERGPNMVVYPGGTWYSGVQPADVPEIVASHFQNDTIVARLANADPGVLYSEICSNRDRMMAAMQARDKAGVLPDSLNQTIRGFQESRAVLTALELDLFTALADGRTSDDAAASLQSDPRATAMLLNALAAMDLIEKRDGVFRPTAVTARYFTAGSPDNARPALLHTAHLWVRWSNLTECIRRGTALDHAGVEARGEDWTEAFIAAMHRNAAERAPLVVHAVGTSGVSRMLDVGGGSGAYSIAFANSCPDLRADIFDLPTVTPLARRYVAAAKLTDRIATRDGDMRFGSFGSGYDLVLVSAICHMFGPAENIDLLKRCRAALAPGGRLVIQDFILESDKTSPRSAALFALNMLVGTAAGSSYSVDEYTAWMRDAGFQQVNRMILPGPTGLMIGA